MLVAGQRHEGVLCPFEPMLAPSGALPEDDDCWAFEPKWDGFRAIVHVKGRVVVCSRRGTDLTDRFPEVAGLAVAVPADTVLDGELVVVDRAGRPDFEAVRQRGLVGRVEGAATFVAFDVLRLGGRDLLAQPFMASSGMEMAGMGMAATDSMHVINIDGRPHKPPISTAARSTGPERSTSWHSSCSKAKASSSVFDDRPPGMRERWGVTALEAGGAAVDRVRGPVRGRMR